MSSLGKRADSQTPTPLVSRQVSRLVAVSCRVATRACNRLKPLPGLDTLKKNTEIRAHTSYVRHPHQLCTLVPRQLVAPQAQHLVARQATVAGHVCVRNMHDNRIGSAGIASADTLCVSVQALI